MRRLALGALALLLILVVLAALVWQFGVRDRDDASVSQAEPVPAPALQAKGEYLARAGNCMLCHTARGGKPYAGGRAIGTPFGTVFSSNLTPDVASGLGAWSAAQFWRALHHGRSRDGRLLAPVFPYTSYAQVTREDSDALFAFLRNQSAVAQTNKPHALRWPYGTQWALAVWRALFFRPEVFTPEPSRDAAWNRGAYLVRGLGHCDACHSPRNLLGAEDSSLDLAGGAIPMQNWYAPSLLRADQAGVADWDEQQVVHLLKTGIAARGSVSGPMAEVVLHSTQYLSQQDLLAIATYLKELPATPSISGVPPQAQSSNPGSMLGAGIYKDRCAQCHGEQGQGVLGAYPALAGNRAVVLATPVNLIQIVLRGGYAPATAGNPRPFGMPPYQVMLSSGEVAAVLTHIRSAWGNQAGPVFDLDVERARAH
ncbi:MAG: cytochrome c [Burkholderiaceae bacterium]